MESLTLPFPILEFPVSNLGSEKRYFDGIVNHKLRSFYN